MARPSILSIAVVVVVLLIQDRQHPREDWRRKTRSSRCGQLGIVHVAEPVRATPGDARIRITRAQQVWRVNIRGTEGNVGRKAECTRRDTRDSGLPCRFRCERADSSATRRERTARQIVVPHLFGDVFNRRANKVNGATGGREPK